MRGGPTAVASSVEQVEARRPYAQEVVATWALGSFLGGVQAVSRSAEGEFDVGTDSVRRGCAGSLA